MSNDHICNYCSKEFSNKVNLLRHQETTKSCLKIQGKKIANIQCNNCKKMLVVEYYKQHKIKCDIEYTEKEKYSLLEKKYKKLEIDYNNTDEKLKNKDQEYKKDIEKYQTEINYLNKTIEKLETKLESYEKKIFEMASRPNTTNTNNNKTVVINNTNLPLTNDVLRQCASTLTLDNARNIEGITRHFTESLEDHITCTDQSRSIFKYTNDKDEEIIDTELENIIPQYLIALKDENNFLYKEVFDYFKTNNVSLSEQTDYNIFYNALNAIIERKGQQNKYSEKMKKYIVRQCKKQFLEKNKNEEKEITKELTDEEIMMNVVKSGGGLYDFIDRLFDMEDIDNETDKQFEYRRKMEDLFKQRKKEWKESNVANVIL
jgi:hypothetical protein